MYYSYYYDYTYILVIIGFFITLGAQVWVNSSYNKYKGIINNSKMTGKDVARKILDANGLSNIKVSEVSGNLTDHYDPSRKVIKLSNDIFNGETIAAVSVAAHECGHAIQDKDGYLFMRIRSFLVPVVNFISYLGYFGLVISVIAGITGYIKLKYLILYNL